MIVYIVLHYISYDMTYECVESLLRIINAENSHIVIVDNGSPNNSGLELEETFKNNCLVDVIHLSPNEGFARGNNAGYVYAKLNYTPDFIVLVSNDVIISDSNFEKKILEIYNETGFFVLGPDIVMNKNKSHQSPIKDNPIDYESAIRLQKRLAVSLKFYPVCFVYSNLMYHLKNAVKKLIGYNSSKNSMDKTVVHENVVLHGACTIFSKKYISIEDEALDSRTYLYMEEDILYQKCKNKNYRIVYNPQLSVLHMDDVDTDMIYRSGYKKTKAKMLEQYKSIKVLIEVLKSTSE